MIRRPPRSTRTDTLFPTRRSSDLLPYQDLSIMEACLKTGVHYMDTANYEPRDEAKRSEEHTSELQSLMRISYAVFCLQKKARSAIYILNSLHDIYVPRTLT